MYKRLFLTLMLIAMAFVMGGCPFIISEEHTRAHRHAKDKGFHEIHKFVDRHFWNYDWEDPHSY